MVYGRLGLALRAFLALALLLPSSEGRKYATSLGGPYWLLMEKVYPCPSEDIQQRTFNITYTAINRPTSQLELQRANIWSEVKKDVTDELTNTWQLDLRVNNQWKENVVPKFYFPRACSTWRSHVPDFTYKVYGVDTSSKGPCVLHAGVYNVTDVALNWTLPAMNEFLYGHYRSRVKLYDKQKLVYCGVVEANVLPRPLPL